MLEQIRPRRRTVVAGVGLGAVAAVAAACGSDAPAPSASATSSTAGTGAALAKTADVPVGSGVIVDDVVITQPTAGVFKGFSAVCPHAGCNVSKITDAKIVCPCHGSKFNLDGSVDEGPASKPLETKAIAVQGGSIVAS